MPEHVARTFWLAGAGTGLTRLLGVLLMATPAVGCTLLPRQGPVAENVVAARQLSQRGIEAIQRGAWREAQALFRLAIEACPVDERARYHYAETLWHGDATGEAIAQMQKAVELSGNDPKLTVRLDQMDLSQGQAERAHQTAEMAIGGEPTMASAWALLGDVHSKRGDVKASLASYHRALSYQPHLPQVQLEIARLYQAQGRPRRALATLQNLGEKYSPDHEPRQLVYLEGLALKALGRHDDAAERLRTAAVRGQPSVEMLYQLGETELAAGRPAAARGAVQQAVAVDGTHKPSRQLLSRIEALRQPMAASLNRLR